MEHIDRKQALKVIDCISGVTGLDVMARIVDVVGVTEAEAEDIVVRYFETLLRARKEEIGGRALACA